MRKIENTRILLFIIWLYLNMYMLVAEKYDWTTCEKFVPGCRCKWVNGKKQANCENANMQDIPTKLNDDIQDLILDDNNLEVLRNDVFKNNGLINLQKISLRRCKIKEIEKRAFRGLALVIEIDLTENLIHRLDSSTFLDMVRLRELYLNNNAIEKLEDGLFSNLIYLQIIELNDNSISLIDYKTFANLSNLTNLKLNNNLLTHIKQSIFDKLPKLSSLEIKNNRWKCDCHLRNFVLWFIQHNLYTHPTSCYEPDNLQNVNWNMIKPQDFACKPEILGLLFKIDTDVNNSKLTLSCKVTGDPRPETYWIFNSRVINNDTNVGVSSYDRKYLNFESEGTVFWYNVTISKVNLQDFGIYSCVTKNAAGIVEKNVSVSGSDGPIKIFGIPRTNRDVWILVVCSLIGMICVLILIFVLLYICCRRCHPVIVKKPPQNSLTSNGDIIQHIVTESEQQKTLLTEVNPVQKPPRKYDSSPHFENDCAELTELNRNLLDNSSVLDGTSLADDSNDDHRSINSMEQLSSYNSQDTLQLRKHLFQAKNSHHPPDLLAFPNNSRREESPANCSVFSNVDNISFRTIHSPLRSPVYQVNSYTPTYEIPIHSAMHSSCITTGLSPVISQREGYVTIPRRPRIPSWSSVPTPTLEDTMINPTYDNLGLRTTASGSSVSSLPRKISSNPPSNIRSLLLPSYSYTLPHRSKLGQNYAREFVNKGNIDETSSSIVKTPIKSEETRSSWISSKNKFSSDPPQQPYLEKENFSPATSKVNQVNAQNKFKVPPPLPPKPNKDGPLFEDEDEDGTEV